MKKSVVFSILIAVVLTIGVIALAMSSLTTGTPDASDVSAESATTTQGDSLTDETVPDEEVSDEDASTSEVATRPDCPAGPVAGVELPCLGGETSSDNATDSGISIVNIWAWWCEPCREELPYLEEIAQAHPEWNVVGVHADRNAGNGAAFLNDLGVDLPSDQDDSNLFAGTLSLPGVIPITLLVVDGEVKERFIQPFKSTEEIETTITKALA